ncbi:hypothetical protein ACOBR2_10955 [Telmatobacter bradus]|uniref:hypothetical protein n=1 Tax=Telmatobacter bradus TaxID=474953 RepID=UPI003B42FB5F
MNEVIENAPLPEVPKRIHRSADEKRRIVKVAMARLRNFTPSVAAQGQSVSDRMR